ncbi:MAG: hypothetical protein LKM32_14450 [Chiayiivirga sp.]|jgi:hypothetical protein|uniref:hypothetical protein n=1 Tax=Chiayiivirga sp. TaxID=2041042 RepID=UPI0025BB4FF4|nr:hypothetical protein [Chiayiivirga sp.]MCI1711503.1 hypothetical protein [Chiayiivirga sp.]MCI1730529.1 hypothetical protein [Chiayiivirga sp.]
MSIRAMNRHVVTQRLALALALSLPAASLVALAGETTETTDIEIVANGTSEKVSLDNLKVGETRQLYSEAGTLVTAIRTADAIELDIAGEKTRIAMFEPGQGEPDEARIEALIDAHAGDADGEKRIVRIEREVIASEGDAKHDGQRKVVIIKGDGSTHDLHGDHPHLLVKHGDGHGDGKTVIVKRRIHKEDEAEAK